jgi:amino acid transporter
MIGWSWVFLTGEWLLRAGIAGTLIAFAIGGTAVIFISLTYAELASAMPRVGGEHVYTLRALGRGPSFICTWSMVMAYITVPVFESAAIPTALEYLFPDMKAGFLWRILDADVHFSLAMCGVVATLIITFVNYIGIKTAAIVQSVITGCFCIVGIMFFTGALFSGPTEAAAVEQVPMFSNGWLGFMGVLIMVPALMVGFDVIPQSAEEIDLPAPMIGSLLIVSVVMAVIWYALITLSVGLSLSPAALESSKMATADANANVWGGAWAGKLMVIAGIGGILTSWNAFIIGASRILYALAESGMLPAAFARLHPRFKTPSTAILFIGFLCCISPFFGRTILVWLIDAGSFAIIIAYAFVAWAFIKLRKNEPDMDRPFRVRHGMFVGYTALVMSIGIGLVYMPGSPSALLWPYEWVMVLGWAILGALLYRIATKP